MTDKPLYEQLVEIGAAKPEAWDEFCAEQHAINAEDHRRAEMVTIDRFEHWWDDGDHDDGPTPLGPLSKETARWIWRAALAAQPAEPLFVAAPPAHRLSEARMDGIYKAWRDMGDDVSYGDLMRMVEAEIQGGK